MTDTVDDSAARACGECSCTFCDADRATDGAVIAYGEGVQSYLDRKNARLAVGCLVQLAQLASGQAESTSSRAASNKLLYLTTQLIREIENKPT